MNTAMKNSIGPEDISTLVLGDNGLLPAVVQHAETGAILMLGYMNGDALRETLLRKRVVFFSRSKGRLWEKGESSGHTLTVIAVRTDCDRDALLVQALPAGPACHEGTQSCFGDASIAKASSIPVLAELDRMIEARVREKPPGSYTTALVESGMARIAQKVGEEALEVAIASIGSSNDEVLAEAGDLLYHLLVLLRARGLSLEQVTDVLRTRQQRPAHATSQL
jgi:phosphoribosyl-ATP pyrophosphohydrolase/phosphoribosyl-AMP cyclohydrolase